MAFAALLMPWTASPGLVEAFHMTRSFLKHCKAHWHTPSSYEGFLKAHRRMDALLVPILIKTFRKYTDEIHKLMFRDSLRLIAVDGSTEPCPRTEANQQAMGDRGKADGIPQASMTMLVDVDVRLPIGFRVGSGKESERAHLRDMLGEIPGNSLLLADAGFAGYDLCRGLSERGQRFLWRVGANMNLLQGLGYKIEEDGATVYLWPLDRVDDPPLALRMIVVREGDREPVHLVTNVDRTELSDDEAKTAYAKRWGIELGYRAIKQTLDFPKVRSRTPDNCYLEMTWTLLGVWLLQLMNAKAVVDAGGQAAEASPAAARKAIHRAMRHQSPCPRSKKGLTAVLAAARLDKCLRKSPKSRGPYPRKKHQKPPRPPNLKPPNPNQTRSATNKTPITLRL